MSASRVRADTMLCSSVTASLGPLDSLRHSATAARSWLTLSFWHWLVCVSYTPEMIIKLTNLMLAQPNGQTKVPGGQLPAG